MKTTYRLCLDVPQDDTGFGLEDINTAGVAVDAGNKPAPIGLQL
jgi:hypothetical protein